MITAKYTKFYVLTICCILHFGIFKAQKSDSLIGLLKYAKEDTNKVNLLNKIASSYLYTQPIKGKPFAEKGIRLSQKLHFNKGEANGYYYLGVIHSLSGNSIDSENSYLRALKIFKKSNNILGQASTLGQIGSIYLSREKFDKALDYRIQSLKLYEQINNKPNIASTYTNIAVIYSRIKQFNDAEKYYVKAIELKHEIGDLRGESIIYSNLGSLFYDQQKFDTSLSSFKKCLSIQDKLGDVRIIAVCKTNIANIYISQSKLDEARKLHNECFEIYKSMGDTSGMGMTLVGLGDIDLKRKNYTNAVEQFNMAVDLIKNIPGQDVLKSAYTGLYQAHFALNNTEKASEYFEKILEIAQSTFNQDLSKNIAQLKEKYEAEKREQDILLLKEQNKVTNAKAEKQKLWIVNISSIAAVLLLGLFLVLAINRNRKKQKQMEFIKIKAELEQTVLRAQMNPHFIFNALNSIQHYILNKETEYAYDYLAKFSKLIRQILINSEENTITLDKEIETLKLYIELEQRRFKNRFDFEISIADDFPANDIMVPTMLIQPFVENAIWHGIMNLGKNIKGKLRLELSLIEKTFTIIVEDNGVGRKEAVLYKINDEYKSVGVLFSQKRLELLKAVTNQKAEIVIHDLTDDKGNASGTKVEITIEMKA